MVVTSETQFDEGNPRYYLCCCGHARTAVMAISIIEISFEASGIIIAEFTPLHNVPNVKWIVPVRAVIMFVCVVLAIIGMRRIVPALLIPHIVMQVIIMVGVILCFIINVDDLSDIKIIIFIFGLYLFLKVLFLIVFVRGYQYLRDKEEFLVNNHDSFVAQSVPMTGYNPTVYAECHQAPGHRSDHPLTGYNPTVYAGGQQASGHLSDHPPTYDELFCNQMRRNYVPEL